MRSTENSLGKKFNVVMAEKGMAGDYAALAAVFDVKTPSIYDWIDHGRLGKDRFARLVEWSGRSLHWWFDLPDMPQAAAPAEAGDRGTEGASVYRLSGRASLDMSAADYAELSDYDRGQINGFAKALLQETLARKSHGANGANSR